MPTLLPQAEFLEKYRIDPQQFEQTTLKWADLDELSTHYSSRKPSLESIGQSVSNQLMSFEKVHSVRYRVKNEEHLIEKIIRKRIQKPERIIKLDNYLSEITDLVGLRAIHLFKQDWLFIHKAITQEWDTQEQPKAYIREGDSEQNAFSENGLEVSVHPSGYRSLHYNAITKPGRTQYITEIQVRTIFEEGWSEIDHIIRYPYHLDNLLFQELSMLLNRLAGSADEMGTYTMLLREKIEQYENAAEANQAEIKRLQTIIDSSSLEKTQKEELNKGIAQIGAAKDVNYLDWLLPPLPTVPSNSLLSKNFLYTSPLGRRSLLSGKLDEPNPTLFNFPRRAKVNDSPSNINRLSLKMFPDDEKQTKDPGNDSDLSSNDQSE